MLEWKLGDEAAQLCVREGYTVEVLIVLTEDLTERFLTVLLSVATATRVGLLIAQLRLLLLQDLNVRLEVNMAAADLLRLRLVFHALKVARRTQRRVPAGRGRAILPHL